MANIFYMKFYVDGAERKRLVQAIAGYTYSEAHYMGAPSFAYQVDRYTIDRCGVVSFQGGFSWATIKGLVKTLAEQGFTVHEHNLGCEEPDATADPVDGLVIQMPADSFTPEALNNLHAIIAAKGRLIRKALDTEHLPIQVEDDIISFPWVNGREITDEEAGAYIHLISAICDMARNQKRITAKEKVTDNDKYAFRCFLLRLGFIGPEYKEERKILLRNLSGSSAFKTVAPQEEATDAVSG